MLAAADKTLKFAALSKIVTKEWKQMDATEREKYEKKSLEDGLDMLSAGCLDPVGAWKHWGRLKIKILPPKAQSAYTLFRRIKEKEIFAANPSEAKDVVKKRITAEWKGLPVLIPVSTVRKLVHGAVRFELLLYTSFETIFV